MQGEERFHYERGYREGYRIASERAAATQVQMQRLIDTLTKAAADIVAAQPAPPIVIRADHDRERRKELADRLEHALVEHAFYQVDVMKEAITYLREGSQ